MSFAIVLFNVTHPGTILKGPEAELPGLWVMVRERVWGGRRRRGGIIDGYHEMLVRKYEELGDHQEPPRYSSSPKGRDRRSVSDHGFATLRESKNTSGA